MNERPGQRMFTVEQQANLVQELAEKADIEIAAAERVLELLHIDKLDENLVALHRVLGDEKAVSVLGMSLEGASRVRETLGPSAVTLENLRVGVKPEGLNGIVV